VSRGLQGFLQAWRACVTCLSCFLVAAMSVASGRAGQRPGGARPPGAAAGGVLEVTGREPDDLRGGETGAGGRAGYAVAFRSVPMYRVIRCGQCRWLQSPLRVSPAGAGGAWGGSASEEAVRRGQSRRRPRRRAAAGQTTRRVG
jgi:hypothetical protein